MSESEVIKMAVVAIPFMWAVVVLIIGSIAETVKNCKNRDLFKDKESQALLKRVKSE